MKIPLILPKRSNGETKAKDTKELENGKKKEDEKKNN